MVILGWVLVFIFLILAVLIVFLGLVLEDWIAKKFFNRNTSTLAFIKEGYKIIRYGFRNNRRT